MPVRNPGARDYFDEWGNNMRNDRDPTWDPDALYDDLSEGGPRRDPGQKRNTNIPDVPVEVTPSGSTDIPGGFEGLGDTSAAGLLASVGGAFRSFGGGAQMGYGRDLASVMLARQGQLGQLDQRTEDMLAKQKEAELMALQDTMQQQRAVFLNDMFGRGVSRSTIAGRAGGMLTAKQGMMAAQVEAAAAARDIELRKNIADRSVAEAQIAQQDIASQRQTAVGMAQVGAENNRTHAMLQMNAMDNATKMKIAEGQLGLGYSQLELDRELGFADLDLRRYGIDKQFELGKYQADASKPKWWQSLLGAAGGIMQGIPGVGQAFGFLKAAG